MGGAGNDGRGMGRVNMFSPDCCLSLGILHCEWGRRQCLLGEDGEGLTDTVQTADFLWEFCTVSRGRRQWRKCGGVATNPKGGKGRICGLSPGQRLSPGVRTVSGRSLQCWGWKGKGSHHHPTHCPGCSAGSFLERQKKINNKKQMAVTISTPSIITDKLFFLLANLLSKRSSGYKHKVSIISYLLFLCIICDNIRSLTVLQCNGILSLLTIVTFNPPMSAKLH